MADQILASALSNEKHLAAFEELAADRLDSIEAEKVLTMLVQAVDVEALESLADQLNVNGFKGLSYASTAQEKRNIISKAIELNRVKGTPYAIKEILKLAGYGGADIEESVGQYYDGTSLYDGEITYSANKWANFTVIVIDPDSNNTELTEADARRLINEYKNARSNLVYLQIGAAYDDEGILIPGVIIMSESDDYYTARGIGQTEVKNESIESLTVFDTTYNFDTVDIEYAIK